MPDNILGGQGATLLTAIVIVAIALLALVGVFWIIRARSTSTFIRGGKNRQPRLAVLDATAVDTRRRLVLIRRDDVEHLIMIGGPSDIVIESRIVHPVEAPLPHKAPALRTEPQAEPFDRPIPAPAAAQRQAAPARPQPQAQPQPQPRRLDPVREPDQVRSAAPQPSSPAQPSAPAQSSSPAQPSSREMAASRSAMATGAAAGSVGSIRAEAFEVLESARARVFEEPSFDEAAYEELTSVPEPAPRAATAPSPAPFFTPEPAPRLESAPSYTPPPASFARATAAPVQPHRPPVHPVPGDFESVLAAELSEDLSLDSEGGHFEPLEDELQPAAPANEPGEAPEVKPDGPPSRDSLEAEMERLLGDLSRKP